MSGRNVTATLSANVSGYIASMNRASAATQQFASKASAASAKSEQMAKATLSAGRVATIQSNTRRAALEQEVRSSERAAIAAEKYGRSGAFIRGHARDINQLARASGLLGVAAGAGAGLAVKSYADFDQAMSAVAATGADARKNQDALRQASIAAGAATKFSAVEAAEGVESLSKAGVSAKDTLSGGLKGALDLAASGNLSVAQSAEAAASTMTQFGLAGKDVTHIADLYAQVAGVAQGDTSDVADAFHNGGVAASAYGLSVDEAAASIAVLAKSGITGAQAGTLLKSSLTNLYAPTGQAKKALDDLGVSAYDAQGAARPLGQVLQDVQDKTNGLDDAARSNALARIFGKETLPGGIALVKAGAAGLAQMRTEFGSFGSAADVARVKMDNLNGDLEQLKGSFETALIGLGESGNGPLRSLTQGATEAVNAFGDLGPKTKGSILALGGGLAAVAISAAGIGKVAVFANEAKVALQGLGVTAKTASLATGAIGVGLAVGAGIFGNFAAKAAESRARVDDLTQSLLASKGAIDGTIASTRAKSLEDSGALLAAQKLGLSIADVTQASLGNAAAQARVNDVLGRYADGVTNAQNVARGYTSGADAAGKATLAQATAADKVREAVGSGNLELQKAVDSYDRQAASAAAAGVATTSAAASSASAASSSASAYVTAAVSLSTISSSASGASQSLSDLASSLFAVNNAALASSNAQIGFEAAIDAASAAAKKNGKSLKVSTDAGRENKTALNNLAAQSQNYIGSLVEQGKGARTVAAATKDARGAFIDSATAMGLSSGKAKRLADQYGLIPKKVRTDVEANAGKAKADLKQVNAAIKGLPKKQQTQVRAAYKKGGIEEAKRKLGELKNKTVTAGTKSDTKGAAATKRYMGGLRDKAVTAGTKSDLSGAKKTQAGVKGVKGKTVTVKVNGDTSGARAAKAAIDAVHSKSVTLSVTRLESIQKHNIATGGLVTDAGVFLRGPLRRSRGGPVWGAGSATSDSIPALLSNGEFVIRAAAVKAIGAATLARMNTQGFATGGLVQGLATGGLPSPLATTDIYKLIAALTNPLAAIAKAAAAVTAANSKIAKPLARKTAADKAYESARDKQETLRDKVNRLAKEAAQTKGITKADKDLRKARLELATANARVTKTSREKTAATKAYNDVAGPSKEATEALVDAQKALAESARSVSDEFAGQYRSTSTDTADWIELMRTGAADLTAFTQKIATLRKSGLSETLVQQIIGMGATAGSEIATQIAAGGKGLVTSLNAANASLQQAADNLGYVSSTGAKRYATGGLVTGPGTGTSDSISAPWLSNGEWVVPARAVSANRAALEDMTYGRHVVEQNYARSHYAGGGMVRLPAIDMGVVRGALAGMRIEGELDVHQDRGVMRGIVVDVMERETGKARTAF